MSTDLKIDLFGEDLFNALWEHHGLGEVPPKSKHPPRKSEFNENIFCAVQVRLAMYHTPYETLFENTYKEFVGNSSYFFDAIVDFFPHYLSGENPNEESVMCRFLSSCAFVAEMCMWCKTRGYDFLDVGPEAWAMFADLHLKDAFYAAGGWEELQVFAKSDLVVYDYIRRFSGVTNFKVVKNVMRHAPHFTCGAVEAFYDFEVWKDVDEDAPSYTLEWVDFCVQVPFTQITNPKYYEHPIPAVFNELEITIWSLSLLCDSGKCDDCSDEDDATCSPKRNRSSSNDKTDSPEDDQGSSGGKGIGKGDELVNLAKHSAKTWEPTHRLEFKNKINDQINFDGNSPLDDVMASKPTTEHSKTESCENADAINMLTHKDTFRVNSKIISPPESLPKTSTGEDSNSPQCRTDYINEKSSLTQLVQNSGCLKVPHQNSILTNDDENDLIFEKSLTVFGPVGKNDLSRPSIEKEYERNNPGISKDSSSTEIYQITEGEKSSAEPTVENPFKLASGAESESTLKTKVYYNELLGKTEYKKPSVKPPNEKPLGFDGNKKAKKKKSKGELNSNDPNHEALLTTEKSENTAAEPELENPSGFPSAPQEVGNKGKKKRPKKRITRLEQRIKEDGNNVVRDLMKLILVMGYQPGIKYVGSTLQDPEKQNSEDENNEE